MTKRLLTYGILPALLLLLLGVVVANKLAAEPDIHVYKSAACGCCNDWIDHLEAAGFKVEYTNVRDLDGIKQEMGLPRELASCHTAVIDDYIIEGHVPASDIQRLLAERPDVSGLSVPGMPHGSPGMETGREDPYQVLSFDLTGQNLEVWSEYNQ
ncbi:DUF411 domain-containing protein [Thioalkalivibrio sp. ALM2T]|uniref:DUF411 domain-containing protein n=1 Tax=Thioalkalivibrio sp. ALM2T TaxID=1158184 RepID=UPI000369464F|nr:DUF411 domain-containing protein [Thioalkalivibrio sp. ALM2T]